MSQSALKTLSRSVLKEAALILTIALLSLGGAILFYAIEGGVEANVKNEVKNFKGDLVKKLVEKSGLGKSRAIEFNKEANKVFQEFEEELLEQYTSGSLSTETKETVWSFTGSLFYVGTVFTTVGYGNICPTTMVGKLLTIVYASVTIPLVLIFLDVLGKIFTRCLKAFPEFVRVFYYSDMGKMLRTAPGVKSIELRFGWPEKRADCEGRPLLELMDEALARSDEEFDLPLLPAIGVLAAYCAFGAVMYSSWEDLDFIDAFYFVFITISTIGFGDVLPEYPSLMILTSLYVFVGLGVCSMVLNVIVEVLQRQMPTTIKVETSSEEKIIQTEETESTNIEEDFSKLNVTTELASDEAVVKECEEAEILEAPKSLPSETDSTALEVSVEPSDAGLEPEPFVENSPINEDVAVSEMVVTKDICETKDVVRPEFSTEESIRSPEDDIQLDQGPSLDVEEKIGESEVETSESVPPIIRDVTEAASDETVVKNEEAEIIETLESSPSEIEPIELEVIAEVSDTKLKIEPLIENGTKDAIEDEQFTKEPILPPEDNTCVDQEPILDIEEKIVESEMNTRESVPPPIVQDVLKSASVETVKECEEAEIIEPIEEKVVESTPELPQTTLIEENDSIVEGPATSDREEIKDAPIVEEKMNEILTSEVSKWEISDGYEDPVLTSEAENKPSVEQVTNLPTVEEVNLTDSNGEVLVSPSKDDIASTAAVEASILDREAGIAIPEKEPEQISMREESLNHAPEEGIESDLAEPTIDLVESVTLEKKPSVGVTIAEEICEPSDALEHHREIITPELATPVATPVVDENVSILDVAADLEPTEIRGDLSSEFPEEEILVENISKVETVLDPEPHVPEPINKRHVTEERSTREEMPAYTELSEDGISRSERDSDSATADEDETKETTIEDLNNAESRDTLSDNFVMVSLPAEEKEASPAGRIETTPATQTPERETQSADAAGESGDATETSDSDRLPADEGIMSASKDDDRRDVDEYSIGSDFENENSTVAAGHDLGLGMHRENTLVFQDESEHDNIPHTREEYDGSEVFKSMVSMDIALEQEAVFGREWTPDPSDRSRSFSVGSFDVETEPESHCEWNDEYDLDGAAGGGGVPGEKTPDLAKADETLSEAASILSDINSILADLEPTSVDPAMMEDALLEEEDFRRNVLRKPPPRKGSKRFS